MHADEEAVVQRKGMLVLMLHNRILNEGMMMHIQQHTDGSSMAGLSYIFWPKGSHWTLWCEATNLEGARAQIMRDVRPKG
jgi:hypothetical protein